MSLTIGGINYQIGMDVSQFEAGQVLTRREMQITRRELRASRGPYADLTDSIEAVQKAYAAGEIEGAEFHRIMVKLNSETPQAKAAQAEYADTVAHAERVLRSLKTPMDDYHEELARNERALAIGKLTQEQVNAANELARQKLPEVAAAQRQAAEAQRQLNDDMRRAEQITRQNETETEQYKRELAELERIAKATGMSEETLARETQRLRVELLGADDATERLSDSMREGRALTNSLMTAEERRRQDLQRAQFLLGRGAISQETYNRQLTRMRREQLESIPVVGQMTSRFLGIPPATLAAGAAIGVLAVEMKLAIDVARMLTHAVREQFGELDKLDKSSKKLGFAVGDLVAYGVAAQEITGIEFGAFETAMQRMTRRTAEAAQGAGEAKKTFDELGLDAVQLQAAGPAGALRMLADAFADVSDEGDRLRLAMRLFDTEGAALGMMLAAGSDELQAYRAELESLGAIPTPFDTSAVAAMNDQVGRANLLIDGLIRDLSVGLAPVIQAVAEEFTESLKRGSSLGDDVRFALQAIPPVIAWIADETNQWIGLFQLAGASADTAAATILGSLAAIDRGHALVNPFAGVNEDLQIWADSYARSAAQSTAEALGRINDGQRGAVQARVREIRDEIAASVRDGDGAATNSEAEAAAAEAAAKLRGEVDQLTTSLQEQLDTFGMTAAEIERYKLAQAGATDEDLRAVQAMQEELEARRQAAEQREALARQAEQETKRRESEAANAAKRVAAEAEREQQRIADEGRALTESLMTDEERRAAAIARATELRNAGAISEEVFARAVAKANVETRESIALAEGIEGAMKGSVEAALSLDRLRATLGQLPERPTPSAAASTPPGVPPGLADPPLPRPATLDFDRGGAAPRRPDSPPVATPASPRFPTVAPAATTPLVGTERLAELLAAGNALLEQLLAAQTGGDRDPREGAQQTVTIADT